MVFNINLLTTWYAGFAFFTKEIIFFIAILSVAVIRTKICQNSSEAIIISTVTN